MDNLEEMDTFQNHLEMHDLPRLNQEETENMNRLTASNETESVIIKKNPPTNKRPKTRWLHKGILPNKHVKSS